MPVDQSVTVKGSPVRSLQKFVESELSTGERESLYAALPADLANRFRVPILATETLPVHIFNVFTEEAAKVKGEPLEAFAQRVGREAASDAIKGIYRFFAMVMTPAALLSRASQMWTSLYNRGEMRVSSQTEHSARIDLVNFPSELAGCNRTTGWLERIAELTGAKNVKVIQTECYVKGAPHCAWTVSWT